MAGLKKAMLQYLEEQIQDARNLADLALDDGRADDALQALEDWEEAQGLWALLTGGTYEA